MGIADTYLNDAVTITPKGTLQGNGRYAFDGTPVVTTGWVRDKTKLVRTREGREVMYQYVVWLASDETVNEGDRITFDGKAHEVLSVKRINDIGNSAQHIKVMCT